ncbi:hypothetical protein [Streptomyces bicolor]|uniref:hypothetical protein n=1 Tax=Streptomyces bicolor TaxID=66874 RepID=UPI0004E239CC|nr:hypothetical protein [Streptomyces bicolor]
MGEELRSLDDILESPNLPDEEFHRIRCEKVLGTTAILLHQQGTTRSAELADMLLEVTSLDLDYQGSDWNVPQFAAYLEVEPHLRSRFTDDIIRDISKVMDDAVAKDPFAIQSLEVRALVPRIGADWRQQLKAANGQQPTNQARRVRLEPQHPTEDGLHFTNEWEWRVYRVLKERQAALPDNDTIGILPLPAMKVLKPACVEPDFLITYRGRAGIIEVDGPYHKGMRSDDHSRERLLRNAGIKQIDRIDVRDTTKKEDVEKFVIDFLKHLAG